jgi:glycine/D-amino acid oxidase-like deaminating enzyme
MDSYRAAFGLIRHHADSGALQVYARTEIVSLTCAKGKVELLTATGLRINARHVVCAPGYESAAFLPKLVMKIHSTYALATQPLPENDLWKERALIWETARPYNYFRTTDEGRIMAGGGDVRFKNPALRDALLGQKEQDLLAQCAILLPHLKNLIADFSWCGSFGENRRRPALYR